MGDDLAQLLLHPTGALGLELDEIKHLLAVFRHVVQLGSGRQDVLPPVHTQGAQRRVVQGVLWDHRVGIARQPHVEGRIGKERQQARPLHLIRSLQFHELQDRWREIDQPNLLLDDLAGRDLPRRPHDQRDVQRAVVEEHGMRVLAVLTPPLAMIRRQDDQRPVTES